MSNPTVTRRALLQSAVATPLLAGFAGCRSPVEQAAGDRRLDLVIVDANIMTMDEARPRAEAVAIKNGHFVAVGSSREIRSLATPTTPTLSLRGKTVLPGLIDAHTHVAWAGRETYLSLNLGLPTVAAIKQAIKEAAARKPKGEWITGNQYDDRKTDLNRFVTRFDIDDVSPDHPVFITERSGHIGVANSAALRMARLTKDVHDPDGGTFDRDPTTGELRPLTRISLASSSRCDLTMV